jgi:microcystin-dependent protein
MTLYKWSKTAENNATADPSINWQEGQAPSSVNDSGRAMMASIAKHRDDVTGAIVTGGTATAYTVASYEAFDALARLNGQIIAFTPHATNGATVTLNVDSLGARPLRSAPGTELMAGTLIQGTPYVAVYNNSDAVFYLQGFYGNPYNVPLASGMDYWGSTAPNSSFAFANGDPISRTTYAALFAIMGTTYGVGNGSTTFNLPDKRGRVSAMKETSAALLTTTYFVGDSTSLGVKGGAESHTLTTAQLATHSHGVTDPGHSHSLNNATNILDNVSGNQFQGSNFLGNPRAITANSNTTGISINNTGSGNPHNNVQPTIICNYIIRII